MSPTERPLLFCVGPRGLPNVEGGAEKNAESIFPRMTGRYRVEILTLAAHTAARAFRGIRLIPVPTLRVSGTDKALYYIFSVFVVAWKRPEVLHCQGLNAAFFLMLYRPFARRIVVRYGAADYVNDKWGPVGKAGFRFCEWQLRFADAVIAVTPSLRDRLRAAGVRTRVEIIPNAIDVVAPAPSVEGDAAALARFGVAPGRFALSVGRVTWQKDYATLIAGFQRAAAGAPELERLVIVGGDDGSGYLQELKAIAGPETVFTGRMPRNEIDALYRSCAVYVNSSLHEGLSNAILEAVSHGAALVVSDIPENLDLPLEPGQFFPARDAEALADRLRAALAAPEAFRAPLSRFRSWDEIAAETMALYDDLATAADAAPVRN